MQHLGTFGRVFLYFSLLVALPASADAQFPSLPVQHYSAGLEPLARVGGAILERPADPQLPAASDLWSSVGVPEGARTCSGESANASWLKGLLSWREGAYGAAAECFKAVVSDGRSTWFVAAGAFWAARSSLFARHPEEVARWLSVAADEPKTFYGLLARRILGLPMPFRWNLNESDQAALAAVKDSAEGQNVLAFIEQGDSGRAERLLRSFATRGRTDLVHGGTVAAESAGLADLAFRMERLLSSQGIDFHRAAYPVPRWRPEGGFSTDRALVYALMRQESNFNAAAVSPAGARGVMQLMPATARFVARASGFPGGAAQFRRPEVNIALGERYLEMLVADDAVGPDLFLLTAAWNGGPANVERWRRDSQTWEDPLLFIESIPFAETRAFIEHVLANLWIYRHRLGLESPSLDALAAGRWPSWDIPRQSEVEIAEHE